MPSAGIELTDAVIRKVLARMEITDHSIVPLLRNVWACVMDTLDKEPNNFYTKIEVRGEDLYLLYGWILVHASTVREGYGVMLPVYVPDELSTVLTHIILPYENVVINSRNYVVVRNKSKMTLDQLLQIRNFMPNPLLSLTAP
jgi:hypothetical protein